MLEVSTQEVDEYYSPKDFQLGKTITLLRRCFQLYDFDGFTKEYYQKNHPDMEMKPIEFPKKTDTPQVTKKVRNWNVLVIFSSFVFFYRTSILPESMWLTVVMKNVFCFFPCLQEVPPYNGFGSLEDSLQNCLSLIPQPPKKNILKMLENSNKVLRYTARLVRKPSKWLLISHTYLQVIRLSMNKAE